MVTEEDTSMLLQGFAHPDLISREIALVLADMVLKQVYGADEIRKQQPLNIADDGDRWTITSNYQPGDGTGSANELLNGPMEMVVLKRNGQIIKLIRHAAFPMP